MNDRNSILYASIIMGGALLLSVIIFASVWNKNQNATETLTVTGSAKKEFVSDLGILRGSIQAESASAEGAYRQLQSQMPVLISYLEQNGFPKNEIELYAPSNYPVYEMSSQGYQTSIVRGYIYNQRIEIKSTDVNKIKSLSLEISSLIEKGVNFNVEMPEYHFTKLADLKVEVQAEAARDAKMRGERIAEATGRSLGAITNARMGVLQITPRLSNMISDYGINDLSSIDKEITAVVNATFRID